MEQAGHQRVPFDQRRQVLVNGFERVGLGFTVFVVRRQHHVTGVCHQEHHAGEERGPQQIPRHVREDLLAPRIASPRQKVHVRPSN